MNNLTLEMRSWNMSRIFGKYMKVELCVRSLQDGMGDHLCRIKNLEWLQLITWQCKIKRIDGFKKKIKAFFLGI